MKNESQGGQFLTESILKEFSGYSLRNEIECYAQGEGTLAQIARALLRGDSVKALQLYYAPPDLFSELAQKMAWNWLTTDAKTVQSGTNFNFVKIEIAKKGNDLH